MFNHVLRSYQEGGARLTPIQAGCLLLLFYIVYQVLLVLYRVTFHPLARFPGPKLAGASYWYEYYYDVTKQGRFIWQIKELHRNYGPIVRINPNELHVNDPEFYDEIYHGKKYITHRDRWYNLDHLGQGLAFTMDHNVHAHRRQALGPFFSMQSIRTLEPRITSVVRAMLDRFHDAGRGDQVLNLYHVFSGYALDIVSEYAFGKELSLDYMRNPEFGKEWAELTMGSISMNNFGRQFKLFMRLMISMPPSVMKRMNPKVGRFIDFRDRMTQLVTTTLKDRPDSGKTEDDVAAGPQVTIFRELINSDLPPRDKTVLRLTDEASMVIGAGGETTAQALTRLFYHVLDNPRVLTELREEVDEAVPDPKEMPTLATLQNLPYLNAVVEEGVRIAFPVPARSPRVFQDHALQLGKWTIEPGTSISMSPWMVTMNEEVFPEPFKFKPERWLGNKELRKYQVTFGKGKRACLGINLAYAELLFAVAMIFRNFDLEMFETTYKDIEIAHDFFVSIPTRDSKGVRVKVAKERL